MIIEKTPSSPSVIFDEVKGTLEIEGRSIMPNADVFYQPLFDYLDVYFHIPVNLTLILDLEYFNTKSSKSIMDLFHKCKKAEKLEVLWYVEDDDEDMKDVIHDFQILHDISINMIIKDES